MVEQGYLAEYVKPTGRKTDQAKKADDELAVVQVNRPTPRVIKAIHRVVDRSTTTKNFLRDRLIRAQFWSQAHPIELLFVLTPKRDTESQLIDELIFTEEDLNRVDTPSQ